MAARPVGVCIVGGGSPGWPVLERRGANASSIDLEVRPVSEMDGTAYPTDHPMLSALSALYAAVPAERI